MDGTNTGLRSIAVLNLRIPLPKKQSIFSTEDEILSTSYAPSDRCPHQTYETPAWRNVCVTEKAVPMLNELPRHEGIRRSGCTSLSILHRRATEQASTRRLWGRPLHLLGIYPRSSSPQTVTKLAELFPCTNEMWHLFSLSASQNVESR